MWILAVGLLVFRVSVLVVASFVGPSESASAATWTCLITFMG